MYLEKKSNKALCKCNPKSVFLWYQDSILTHYIASLDHQPRWLRQPISIHFINLFVARFSPPNGEIIVIWHETPPLQMKQPPFSYVSPLNQSTQMRLPLPKHTSSFHSAGLLSVPSSCTNPALCLFHIVSEIGSNSQQLQAFVGSDQGELLRPIMWDDLVLALVFEMRLCVSVKLWQNF